MSMKSIGAIGLLVGLAAMAGAQGTPVYSAGRSIKDQGISVRPWGSGTIAETDEMAFEGTTSVRVSARNYFQGGRMVFARPIDLSRAFEDKDNLFLIAFKTADEVVAGGGGGGGLAGPGREGQGPGRGGGAGPGKGGGAGPGKGGGGGPDPGGGGMSMGGGQGGPAFGGPGGGQTSAPRKLGTVRFLITTSDGMRSEAYLPVSTSGGAGERGWRTIGLPLRAISGFERTNKMVSEIALATDTTATFWIGEIKVLADSTPIYGEPNTRELNLPLGADIVLSATGSGGASVLKYAWDFDSSDGIQVDAEGQAVRRKFRKPGNYTITLTVSDVFGLKKPHSSTINVVVNP